MALGNFQSAFQRPSVQKTLSYNFPHGFKGSASRMVQRFYLRSSGKSKRTSKRECRLPGELLHHPREAQQPFTINLPESREATKTDTRIYIHMTILESSSWFHRRTTATISTQVILPHITAQRDILPRKLLSRAPILYGPFNHNLKYANLLQDFWSLVWEQDVRVIVMLTAEMEGGQMKCHPYWQGKHHGPLELQYLNESRVSLEQHYSTQDNKRHSGPNLNASKSPTADSNVPHIVVRRFFLKHSAFPFAPGREITQLQYSHWPDFGAPAHPAHILGLVEHTDAVVRACSPSKAVFTQEALANVPAATANIRPVLVHCSAGCGRTGAFCTIDSVIGMLRRQRFHKQYGFSRGSDELEAETPGSRSSSRGSNRPTSPTSEDNSWLEHDDQDLIAEVVHDFRKQRLSMVQSLRQYVLCYETVLEWIARQKPLDSAKRKAI